MKMLYAIIIILFLSSTCLLVADVVTMLNYDEDLKCHLKDFQKDSTLFLIYWLLSRSVQSLMAPAIALWLFWRPRIKVIDPTSHQAQMEAL